MRQSIFFTSTWLLGLVIMLAPRTHAHETRQRITEQDNGPSAIGVVAALTGDNSPQGGDQSSNEHSLDWNAILVIVTSITAGLIFWQAWETRRAAQTAADSVAQIKRQADILERQTIATEKAANAAEKSAGTAETAMKIIEAADILIESAGLSPQGAITPQSYIALKIRNFGRTRAENVRSSITIIIPDVPNSEPSPETFSLGPNGTQVIRFLPFKQFLTERTFQQIQEGAISVRFSGELTYSDRFGDQHALPCKGILNPRDGTFILGDRCILDNQKTKTT